MASHEALSGEPAFRADASELRATVVAATAEVAHAAAKNLLHCATFELAWRELQAFAGGAVRLLPSAPLAEELERAARALERDDLDDASYVARAGVGDAVLADIRAELARKFGGAASPRMLPEHVADDELFLYAYLFKNLVFEKPFAREEEWGLSFAGTQVQHFGVWPGGDEALAKARARQVIVHDHRSDTDFVVELTTRARGDRLIVARLAPEATLAATAARVIERATPSFFGGLIGGSLRPQDELRIPMADFDILRRYDELSGKKVEGREAVVAAAEQSIRFRLDDKGALLKSEVYMTAPRGGLRPGFPPRRFVCDGPFLVLLVRSGRRTPYFALWIDNTELLLAAKPVVVARDPRLAR